MRYRDIMPRQIEMSANAGRMKALKAQQDNLQRNSSSLLRNLNNIFKHGDLKLFMDGIEKQSEEDKTKFTDKMLLVQKSLESLDKKALPAEEDVEPLREFLFSITDSIVSLKQENLEVLKNLSEQEKNHQHDLDGLEKRIDDFVQFNLDRRIKPPMKKAAAPGRRISSRTINDDAAAFDRLLANEGGHTGFWDEEDHLLFLRHRTKSKGQRLADSVHAVLPDISPEAVTLHEEWYKRYQALRAQQRGAIQKWRAERKKPLPELDLGQPGQKAWNVVSAAYAEEKKKKILEWKAAKQKEQQLEEESRAARLQEEKRALKKKREREALRRRVSLIPGREAEAAESPERPAPACDLQLIRMFRERDREVVAASLKRIEERNRAKAEKATIKRRPSVVAERDPGRLLQPTQVWKQRLLQRYETDPVAESKPPLVLTVGNLPRLRVPSWRQGAS